MSGSGKMSLGYREVTVPGIGGMAGGGIFAVLGLPVQLTGGGAPGAWASAPHLIAGGMIIFLAYEGF